MAESLLSIFRHERQPRPENEERSSPHGYIQIGEKRVNIKNRLIYAGSTNKPVKGEISSNVVGLIEAVHRSIELTIKPPDEEEKQSSKDSVIILHPQKIGDIPSSNAKVQQLFSNQIARDTQELEGLVGQTEALTKQLGRLNLGDTPVALNLLKVLQQKRESLLSSRGFCETQKNAEANEIEYKLRSDILSLWAIHADITVRVNDPEVFVNTINIGKKDIQGVAPENSQRVIRLYLTDGTAYIKYPSSSLNNTSF